MNTENKRILAFFLCGLVLIYWLSVSRQKAIQQASQKAKAATSSPAVPADVSAPAAATTATKPLAEAPTQPATVAALPPQNFVLENDQLHLTLSNQGGRIIGAWLKQFAQRPLPKGSAVKEHSGVSVGPEHGVQFLEKGASVGDVQWDLRVDGKLQNEAIAAPGTLNGNQVSFDFNNGGPLKWRKTFVLNQSSHLIQVQLQIENTSDRVVAVEPVARVSSPIALDKLKIMGANDSDPLELAAFVNDKLLKEKADGLTTQPEGKRFPGNAILWSGLMDRYFLKALVPDRGMASEVVFGHQKDAAANLNRGDVSLVYPLRQLGAGEKETLAVGLYLGPKDLNILSAFGKKLERSIDLGDWIGVISRPLLSFMRWIYGYVGNYGWAIILLTLMVRLVLYPLTHVQYRSMKKMQNLKPYMDDLKTRYKDNKEELNRQMIQLFRTHKVNPMGGCLPLLLQMPVFFALYRVLYNAIELRHAPFMGWIQDLSAKDPYYVTPVLMAISMYLQQRMTPSAGMDPAQEQMMKFMPLMFAFFMLYLPSGLVVYIFVSTMLGVLQQWMASQSNGQSTPATPAKVAGA